MNKSEFLSELRERLAGLPEEDIARSVDYYSEMIDDRVEEGLSEEEAVRAMGSVEEVAAQILTETPLPKLVKARVRRNRSPRAWEIILLILGSPVWLPLVIAALAIFLTVYLVAWSVILSLYAVDFSVAVSGIAGFAGAFVLAFGGRLAQGVFLFGGGLSCAGLAVLMFFGFNFITKGLLFLSKKMILGIKSCFIRKGDAPL